LIAVLSALLLSAALPVSAADLSSVDALYWHRNEPQKLDQNIAALDDLLKASPDDAELLWRKGRSVMRRGEKKDRKSDRLADYLAAEELLKRSVTLKPDVAESHFFYGVTMGRRGEAQGILKSLFLIKPIKKEMAEVIRLDPNHGGAHRVLAEILWQVPGFAGGDKKQALAEFETSIRLSPNYTANYQPLAEAYLKYDRKDDAIKTLKAAIAVTEPADPAAAPDDKADAQKLLDKISR
jgi:tetratricopeptide (TPR) repeat protein